MTSTMIVATSVRRAGVRLGACAASDPRRGGELAVHVVVGEQHLGRDAPVEEDGAEARLAPVERREGVDGAAEELVPWLVDRGRVTNVSKSACARST